MWMCTTNAYVTSPLYDNGNGSYMTDAVGFDFTVSLEDPTNTSGVSPRSDFQEACVRVAHPHVVHNCELRTCLTLPSAAPWQVLYPLDNLNYSSEYSAIPVGYTGMGVVILSANPTTIIEVTASGRQGIMALLGSIGGGFGLL